MSDSIATAAQDIDPVETQEWLDALDSIVKYEGHERAQYILSQLQKAAQQLGLAGQSSSLHTPYINTLSPEQEEKMPDDGQMQQRLTNFMRWNALAMLMRAHAKDMALGGHISTYMAIATLYEVGLNHFFHAPSENHGGDLVYFQGHSSEGLYARGYLEGRFDEKMLDRFRQEVGEEGLSSYPHPWLMPNYWQFPTVSMGLGPLMAIYQAQFLKYLQNRGLAKTDNRKVWVFMGDGETGEPESLGDLIVASREKLDNLIFVLNCNLQRLDGPVSGNGQIIQEMEGVFRGAGWHVIKVVWGSAWEALFAKDKKGLLMQRISELVDGEYQSYSAKDGAYMREHFFGKNPELLALVSDMSDADLKALQDGGHDPQKVYAAYAAAIKHQGQPTVILAKTVKGYGLGGEAQGLNIAHNVEKLSLEGLKAFRDRFQIPLDDQQVEKLTYYKPAKDSAEMQYLQAQREKLGGYLPARYSDCEKLMTPKLSAFQALLDGTGEREISTSMAFARILSVLLKDKNIKEYIVPIVADEARSLGLEGLFRQVGICALDGQKYTPEDRKQLIYYREEKTGQLLQQGIDEAGAMASWIAAATSYASNKVPMMPFYAYYSMFGYQRIGDLVWAASDIRARGFLIGGTAGRTTLAGEGLQHQDGHNVLMFGFTPRCIAYDPAFAYEMAVIIRHGIERMYEKQEDVFFYITMMNENYQHPAMPKGAEKGIVKGMYLFQKSQKQSEKSVQLLGSGTILREVIKAAAVLEKDYGVAADVWSVTSFNELGRDVDAVIRENRLNPGNKEKISYVTKCLQDQKGPVIAASDYIKLSAEQIRPAIQASYHVLGTDGLGRSDGRVALRDFFEVDTKMIVYTALTALADEKQISMDELKKAAKKLKIDAKKQNPMLV